MNSRAVEQNWETSIRRRRLVIALVTLVAALVSSFAAPAGAQAPARTFVDVVELSGPIDRILADFLSRAIDEANAAGAEVLVVRLDSPRSLLDAAELDALGRRIASSNVPVAVWIGPGRDARAGGGARVLFDRAAVRGMAPGSRAGDTRAEVLVDGGEALPAATLGDFIIALDGAPAGGRTISIPTEVVRREGRPPQRQLATGAAVRFDEPSLVAQLLHAMSTPSAAYLLLVAGLLLLVFEFFTGGVGVAAGVGVLSLVLAAYGLGALPTRPLGLALVALGVFGYAVDVQAGAPRAWTAIGTVLLTAGSFFLLAGMSVPLLVLAAVLVATVVFMVGAMPAVIRTRYSTPTIGRESMLGEEGEALSDVDPDGVVSVRGAPWRARTNRATPIRAGDRVKVAAIDGLLLEVEPLEGAARDYRH